MHRYHSLGKIPKKRHTIFRKDNGDLYYEELKGNKGFDGASSLLYHIHRPTRVIESKVVKEIQLEKDPDARLRMRHFKTAQNKKGGSPTMDRSPLMFNQDVSLWMVKPDLQDDFFYRNGQADEVIYVSHGEGTLHSIFGKIPFREGDYLVIPRGILHNYSFKSQDVCFLVIESAGEVKTPPRYRNEFGQLKERSPFSERDFRVPEELETFDQKGEYKIRVKMNRHVTEITVDHHPYDLVGWDGIFFPYAFNIHDFEPIVGRIHEPPTVHQTFESHNFVICSFCPRLYDFDENAIPAPYHHANVNSDEVIYYASHEFMSRKDIEYGSLTLHPDGLVHGPHPGKVEASIGKTRTDELAVMVDTFYPMHVAKQALDCEDPKYEQSWLES